MKRRSFLNFIRTATLAVVASAPFAGATHAQPLPDDAATGAVYTMTNSPGGNGIVIFDRDGRGTLTLAATVPTGGLGTGGGLDPLASQGSLTLTQDARWLLAVNAGSDDVSVLRVRRDGLELVDNVASGGTRPTSIAVYQNLVYVLNEGGAPNVTGFTLNHRGHLSPIAGSTRALGAGLHAQIGFDPRGSALVVTDRSSNRLLVYPVGEDGTPAATAVLTPSHGAAPFSFAFAEPATLFVAEVGSNAVSSYRLNDDGTLDVVSGSVANGQAATCWITTAGTRFVFTANPGASSVSSYREQPGSGEIELVAGAAAGGSRPLDLAASANGRFLYSLDPGSGGIDAFRVGPDGTLVDLGASVAGLPLYAQGLAAR